MPERGWERHGALVQELHELLVSRDLPGDFPDVVREVERLVSAIRGEKEDTPKCGEVLIRVRRFYGCRSKRSWSMSKIEYTHGAILGNLASMRFYASMMNKVTAGRTM